MGASVSFGIAVVNTGTGVSVCFEAAEVWVGAEFFVCRSAVEIGISVALPERAVERASPDLVQAVRFNTNSAPINITHVFFIFYHSFCVYESMLRLLSAQACYFNSKPKIDPTYQFTE